MNINKDAKNLTKESSASTHRSLTLREVKDILQCEVLSGEDKLDMSVDVACGADLMSDVLAFIKPNALLLTGLTNAQVIRTAEMVDIKAIVFVRGKQPTAEALELAKEKRIPLLSTKFLMYESCGQLYKAGLPGGSELDKPT